MIMRKTIEFAILAAVLLIGTVALSSCGSDKNDEGGDSGGAASTFPSEYRNILGKYMPIYEGANPPKLDGTFLLSPDELVYTSDGAKSPGAILDDWYIRFFNQNTSTNSISCEGTSGSTIETGYGSYIIGSGNNFTVFLTTELSYKSSKDKRLTVYSGTVTSNGISNLHWGWIITESDDPDGYLPSVGTYRIFKDGDGTSVSTTWPK